jgi:hypothetical protein
MSRTSNELKKLGIYESEMAQKNGVLPFKMRIQEVDFSKRKGDRVLSQKALQERKNYLSNGATAAQAQAQNFESEKLERHAHKDVNLYDFGGPSNDTDFKSLNSGLTFKPNSNHFTKNGQTTKISEN